MPVVEQRFDPNDRPNLYLAIQELLDEPGRKGELVGVVKAEDYRSVSLAKLSRAAMAEEFDEGPVEYADVALPDGQQLACVKCGLWFLHDDGGPVVLLLTQDRYGHPPDLITEVMAGTREAGERFLRRLTRLTRYAKAHRGHVLSLEKDCFNATTLNFHRLPSIRRDEIILPESLLRRIERHTLSFSRHAEKLRSAGRHLKRGILLHGPPGTGKTLSAMYLAAQMPGRTVLLLTGAGMGIIQHACRMARVLEPATVILEDVDLIGTQREHQTVGANALLFELLNEMDGLADDVDILFVLTTNRPDILEPALASRPGRIDQAIEVPLPSGAFIRELLRKAAVFAAEEDGAGETLVVRDPHVEEALTELLVAGGVLTQSLLGASRGSAPSPA